MPKPVHMTAVLLALLVSLATPTVLAQHNVELGFTPDAIAAAGGRLSDAAHIQGALSSGDDVARLASLRAELSGLAYNYATAASAFRRSGGDASRRVALQAASAAIIAKRSEIDTLISSIRQRVCSGLPAPIASRLMAVMDRARPGIPSAYLLAERSNEDLSRLRFALRIRAWIGRRGGSMPDEMEQFLNAIEAESVTDEALDRVKLYETEVRSGLGL